MKRAGINRKQLQRTISRGLKPKLRKEIEVKARAQIQRAKALMLAEFNQHPVTKEIESGPGANNISGTLGGIGNLFSFLGFENSDKPIPPVRRILEQSTRLTSIKKAAGDKLAFEILIQLPSKEDIAQQSPLPWAAARSWVIGIEQGLSGFGSFLAKPGAGRSEGGIQVTGVMRGGSFKHTKYISEILGHLNSNLRNFLRL